LHRPSTAFTWTGTSSSPSNLAVYGRWHGFFAAAEVWNADAVVRVQYLQMNGTANPGG
jgi:hypothetical protein